MITKTYKKHVSWYFEIIKICYKHIEENQSCINFAPFLGDKISGQLQEYDRLMKAAKRRRFDEISLSQQGLSMLIPKLVQYVFLFQTGPVSSQDWCRTNLQNQGKKNAVSHVEKLGQFAKATGNFITAYASASQQLEESRWRNPFCMSSWGSSGPAAFAPTKRVYEILSFSR